MSGAEAVAVLGVISSIISIVDGTKQVYEAATNAQGLPEAFRAIADRLPILRSILGSAKQHIDEGDVDENSCKGVKPVVKACEKKANKLDTLFQKAIPKDDVSDLERYYEAVKAYGKGNEVENLMKGMLEDVQLLACERGIKTATKAQQVQIAEAVIEVSAVLPSVPEHVFQESGFAITNYGSGPQYNAQGGYVALGDARQYNTGGGAMYFEGSMEDGADACMSALFVTDPKIDREQLIQAKGSRVDGTCEWIKSHKLYNSWLHSRSQLLWLSGGPGKGKTMLSIFLAEELERTVKQSQDMLFLQYFCDYKDEKRKTAVTIIRGLIFQLLKSQRKLFDHILPSFKIQKESLFAGSSFETLWKIFEMMIHEPILSTTYCVLDGLDECDEALLEVLLRKIAALFSAKTNESSVCHLSLIVVSRDLPEFIPELLSSFPRIRLDPDADTEINNDIYRFIEVKVDELSVYREYPEPLCVYVKKVFRKRAQGTFLWVGIVAKALKKYKATEVEIALDLFPQGLDELYARMLLQVDTDRREIAIKILRWVVMAVRPLTLSELSIAIDITVGPSVAFSREKAMRDQVSGCGSLLTIKKNEVGLIHQSAKDYLLRKTRDSNPKLEMFRVKEEVVNLEVARKCLNYLQSGALAAGKVDLRTNTPHLRAFPLLSYATLHWPEHARSLACSEDIFDLSLPFYHKKSPIRESWLKTYWAEKWNDSSPDLFTPLHLASLFGILPLAENLLLKEGLLNKVKRKIDLNKMDSRGTTALYMAAKGGHEAVVRLLLEKRADLEAKDSNGCTALHATASGGHEAVVRLLLEKRADLEAKDSNGCTALHAAASGGHEAVVRLLLEKRADLEAKQSDGETALHMATRCGHEAVMRLLLDKGADPEVRDPIGWTALLLAAGYRHEAVVRLLLDKGVDLKVKNLSEWTALHMAAGLGQEAVVRLLLEKGLDLDAKNSDGKTALHVAVGFARVGLGHKAVVQLLLEKGADLEAKESDGMTALHLAAKLGHEAMVRLLLEKGADLDAKRSDGRTALHVAAGYGHESVVRLLLEKGADVEAKDKFGETVLGKAVDCGHQSVAQLLLEKEEDLKAKDELRGTALHKAALQGRDAVVRLLLEKGADLEANDSNGCTALHAAASGGHEAVVRLLLEKRADLEAKQSGGWTPLLWAAGRGHEAVVRLLLEKGADFEAKQSEKATALHLAAGGGHETVVRLLLEEGADLEAKDSTGWTALLLTAWHGHEAVMRLLLEKGADVKAKRSDGRIALHMAAECGHEAVVRLLLDKGADLEVKYSNGWTALLLAAEQGHEAVVRLLLEEGADLEAKDSDGVTALHVAAGYGHESVVRLLLKKGADVEAKDKFGETVLDKAIDWGHEAVVRLLLEVKSQIYSRRRLAVAFSNQDLENLTHIIRQDATG